MCVCVMGEGHCWVPEQKCDSPSPAGPSPSPVPPSGSCPPIWAFFVGSTQWLVINPHA